jgi:hypothetical protein
MKKTGKGNIKGRLAAAGACVALVATLGAATALAAKAGAFSSGGPSPSSPGAKSVNVAPSKDGLTMHIAKDGTHFYSVDGGETWNGAIPGGFTLDREGNLQKIK